MQLVCDLEVHSKYSRAVSHNMLIPTMVKWALWKGIDVLGTGDFTHPFWFDQLNEQLEEDGTGLLKVKNGQGKAQNLRFVLTGEVSSIYTQGGKGRRIHTILVAPSFAAAKAINQKLSSGGKLSADGRPVLGLSAKSILRYVLDVNEQLGLSAGGFIIPAHVWTPWFGLYGSKSGFDSLQECFEELTPHVHALETGLSSDPPMNWRLSANDAVALTSFSDAHSAPNLMREATVVEVKSRTYEDIAAALQNPVSRHRESAGSGRGDLSSKEIASSPPVADSRNDKGENCIAYTLEFFPEEGKYHYDGIAGRKLRLTPVETKQLQQDNPALANKVTIGVMHRVDDLADRAADYRPTKRPGYISMIPLQEIIADYCGLGKQSKRVQAEYEQLVMRASEFDLLVRLPAPELRTLIGGQLADAVLAVRAGEIVIEPGYDGVYGTIQIKKKEYNENEQLSLL